MSRSLFLIALAIAVASNATVAQVRDPAQAVSVSVQRPDFSGNWTLVSGKAPGPLGTAGTIVQQTEMITFTEAATGQSLTYVLNGRPSTRESINGWKLTSQARWVSSALTIVTTFSLPARGPVEDMVICSLDQSGRLTMVTIEAPREGPQSMTTRLWTYTKG